MEYSEFVEVYNALGDTTKRLEKETILSNFLKRLAKHGEGEWIYLLRGRVWPDYDERELGVSNQLIIKAIAFSFGIKTEAINERFKTKGDLGEIAEEFAKKKKQQALFSKKLTVLKVFENLRRVMELEGKGSVERKIELIAEILGNANGEEAKYIVRTVLGDLRIGVADATLREAIGEAFFGERKADLSEKLEVAYDMCNDFAVILKAVVKGEKELDKIGVIIGRPMNVMLPVKVTEIDEAFRICGRPAAIEHKYDGFRMLINKKGKEVFLFTRRLENVTKQFPDVVEAIKKYVKGEDFIIDSEVVGYDPKTKRYRPFEAISQRIKRKYDIDKIIKDLPVEVNVFDVIYHNGKSYIDVPFKDRRKILEKIIIKEEWKIRPSTQIVTDSNEEAMKFYKEALKIGEEGIMIKNLETPYRQGRRVGYIVKMKPNASDLDLVITGAEYGSGKRAGTLSSYVVACRENGKFLEIGKVSSGLKEKEEEGFTYEEMTKLLRPLVLSEKGKEVKIKPKIVVAVTYQNIQASPSYDSGFAMRFPRITNYRPDKKVGEIATLEDIKMELKRMQRNRSHLG
ncbi:MAG: ATP-dependent DNA ligase [Nanoarchaeota archaeon]